MGGSERDSSSASSSTEGKDTAAWLGSGAGIVSVFEKLPRISSASPAGAAVGGTAEKARQAGPLGKSW